MERRNCWEEKQCGREPGGAHIDELGICPAALPGHGAGINGGTYRGRICWAIAGTLCHGTIQGTYARKLLSCLECPFMSQVHEEEGRNFVLRPRSQDQPPCVTPDDPQQPNQVGSSSGSVSASDGGHLDPAGNQEQRASVDM